MTKVIRESKSNETAPSPELQHPRRKFGRWLSFLLIAGGATLFFLPSIAGQVLQSPGTLAWLSGQPAGTIAVGQANFSWQGPVQLKNVVLQTADGHPIANVASLTSERTLWNLLTQPSEPLKLQLSGVHLNVTVSDPGPPQGDLDLSELVNALQTFQVPCPSRPIEVAITDSTIDFENERYEPIDSWSNISGTYRYDATKKLTQTVTATVPASPERGTGALLLQGEWTRETTSHQRETITLNATGDRVSLAAADAWLRKYLGSEHGLISCSGAVEGNFQREREAGWELAATAKLNQPGASVLSTEQVAFADPPPQAGLELRSKFSKPDDELSISRLHLAADNAAVDLQGSVKKLSGPQILSILAEVQTPGSALMDFLPPQIREKIQVEGMKFSQISINGALLPAADGTVQPLTYSLLASWDKALAYGLESQNGQIKVSYSQGQVRAEPVNVPLGGGKLLMLPALDMRTDPPNLHFQAGTMLENVTLTEGICRDWLMYISPTLANATSAEGSLTLVMKEGQMPLGHMEKAELGGSLAIRNGVVKPGPLAIQILQQVAQVQQMLNRGAADLTQKALLTMKQEDVIFQLHEGRVYHDNFGAYVGDMRFSTSGSVGLDKTLAMQLNLALPEKWLAADRPVLQVLASQPIVLGVGGTLDDPRIDASGMAEFGKQIGIKAGVGLLEKLIERRQQRNR